MVQPGRIYVGFEVSEGFAECPHEGNGWISFHPRQGELQACCRLDKSYLEEAIQGRRQEAGYPEHSVQSILGLHVATLLHETSIVCQALFWNREGWCYAGRNEDRLPPFLDEL